MKWMALSLVLLLTACTTFRTEPKYLEFPEVPAVQWMLCHTDVEEYVCLTEDDALTLLKWVEKIKIFEESRKRLLRDS